MYRLNSFDVLDWNLAKRFPFTVTDLEEVLLVLAFVDDEAENDIIVLQGTEPSN